MIKSLLEEVMPQMNTLADVYKVLGEADGKGVTIDTPWELFVRCNWGYSGCDYMIYWPTHRYALYSGKSVIVDDWMYIYGD
jgi:hypothetical protein